MTHMGHVSRYKCFFITRLISLIIELYNFAFSVFGACAPKVGGGAEGLGVLVRRRRECPRALSEAERVFFAIYLIGYINYIQLYPIKQV